MGYIVQFVHNGAKLTEKQKERLHLVTTVYEQQRIMFESGIHSVPPANRPVWHSPGYAPSSVGNPHANTEFGAKLHISLVENYAQIERLDFEAYNESEGFGKLFIATVTVIAMAAGRSAFWRIRFTATGKLSAKSMESVCPAPPWATAPPKKSEFVTAAQKSGMSGQMQSQYCGRHIRNRQDCLCAPKEKQLAASSASLCR